MELSDEEVRRLWGLADLFEDDVSFSPFEEGVFQMRERERKLNKGEYVVERGLGTTCSTSFFLMLSVLTTATSPRASFVANSVCSSSSSKLVCSSKVVDGRRVMVS